MCGTMGNQKFITLVYMAESRYFFTQQNNRYSKNKMLTEGEMLA